MKKLTVSVLLAVSAAAHANDQRLIVAVTLFGPRCEQSGFKQGSAEWSMCVYTLFTALENEQRRRQSNERWGSIFSEMGNAISPHPYQLLPQPQNRTDCQVLPGGMITCRSY